MEEAYNQSLSSKGTKCSSNESEFLFNELQANEIIEANRPQCYFTHKMVSYLDGELDSVLSHCLSKHIHSCAECNERYNVIGRGLKLISKGIPKLENSEEAFQDIQSEIKSLLQLAYDKKRGALFFWRRRFYPLTLKHQLSVIAILITLILLLVFLT